MPQRHKHVGFVSNFFHWTGITLLGSGIALLFVILLNMTSAKAQEEHDHYGPNHWYPLECCSRQDCRPLPDDAVNPGAKGWELYTGEVIPYGHRKERQSKDGRFHRCSTAYRPNASEGAKERNRTICLFVPGMAM